jgi:hypothetical protein
MSEKFQDVESAVKSVTPLLQEMKTNVDALAKSLLELNDQNKKVSKSQEELTKKQEAGEKTTKELSATEQQRVKLLNQLSNLRKTGVQENQKLTEQIKAQKKANSEWAKEQVNLTTAHQNQIKELKKAEEKYKNLVTQGKENTKTAKNLETKIVSLSESVKKSQAAVKNLKETKKELSSTEKESIKLKKQLIDAESKEALENEKLKLKIQEQKKATQNAAKEELGLKKVKVELSATEKEQIKLKEQLKQAQSSAAIDNERLRQQLQKQKKATREAVKAEQGLTGAYDKQKSRVSDLISSYKNLAAEGKQNTAEGKKLKKEIDSLVSSISKIDSSVKKGSRGFKSLAKQGIAMGIGIASAQAVIQMTIQATIKVFKNALKSITSFEKGLSEVKAITGATIGDFQKLRNNAIELGSSTQKSALDVAKLQKEFAKLGFSTQEIINATEATIGLSIAAGSDLAESATVAASTIRGFSMDTKETQRVVDVMAKSFTSSALDMEKFKTGMAIAAPVAKSFNKDIEFTTAQLGVLSDAGLDASTAGTSLRNMFLELSAKGMTWDEGLEAINNSTNKNVTALNLFGKRGATAALILADNTEKSDRLEKSLRSSAGAAQTMADIMADNLAGDVGKAKSAWEGLVLTIGDNTNLLRKAVQIFTRFTSNITESIKPQEKKVNLYQLENKELNTLFTSLKDTNLSQEARNKLIDKINSDYGEYLPNLLTEESTLKEIEAAQTAVNKQIRIKIIQQAFQEEINDLLKAELEAQEGLVQSEIERSKLEQERFDIMNQGEQQALEVKELNLDLVDSINKATVENNEEEVNNTKEKFKRIGELYGIAFEEISSILEEQEEKISENIAAEIEGESRKEEILLRLAERRAKYLDTIREKEQAAFLQNLEDENQEYENSITNQVDKEYDMVIDSLNLIENERLRILTEAALKEIKLKEDTEEAKKELAEQAISSAAEYASDLLTSSIDTELSEYETSQDAKAEVLQNRLDKGEISESQYQEAIAELEAATEKKRAKAEKQKALYTVAIETAQGAIRAIAASPKTFGIPFLPYVLAQGAIQAATIAATPLGAFKDGTGPTGTDKDMLATVSELGSELGILPSGEGFLTPDKETNMFLPKGTRIFSNDSAETQAILQGGITPEQFNTLILEERKTRQAILKSNKASGWQVTPKGLSLRDKERGVNKTLINKKIRWE